MIHRCKVVLFTQIALPQPEMKHGLAAPDRSRWIRVSFAGGLKDLETVFPALHRPVIADAAAMPAVFPETFIDKSTLLNIKATTCMELMRTANLFFAN